MTIHYYSFHTTYTATASYLTAPPPHTFCSEPPGGALNSLRTSFVDQSWHSEKCASPLSYWVKHEINILLAAVKCRCFPSLINASRGRSKGRVQVNALEFSSVLGWGGAKHKKVLGPRCTFCRLGWCGTIIASFAAMVFVLRSMSKCCSAGKSTVTGWKTGKLTISTGKKRRM